MNSEENGTYISYLKFVKCIFILFKIKMIAKQYFSSCRISYKREAFILMSSVRRFTQELMCVKKIMKDIYHKLKNTEFLLNEWGVVSNYEKSSSEYPPLELRDSKYSSLFTVKLAAQKLFPCVFIKKYYRIS